MFSTTRSTIHSLRINFARPCFRPAAPIFATQRCYSTQQAQNYVLKTPKGTKDYTDQDMAIREQVFSTVTRVFRRHGAVTIDTPVMELKDILSGKYGEDSKLIYDLADQGGESCSLRYDLTVPFARFVAMHGKTYHRFKRYHIAKVYRRDQPAMTKGRLREFYQCDFDIAGEYDPMLPDAEVLKVLCDALTRLDIGPFTVKLNHRKILDGIFEACGVPHESIRSVSSAVDKLDKVPWADVKQEMIEVRQVAPEVADKIGRYVKLNGGRDLLETLAQDAMLQRSPTAQEGIADMRLLYDYMDALGVADKTSFDLSLARGLDYYTGIIYEAIPHGEREVGSIAAGGRYDNLVGMFAGTNKKGQPIQVPCVGVSLGVERIFAILQAKQGAVKSNDLQVCVVSAPGASLLDRLSVARQCWDADIPTMFAYKQNAKMNKQWEQCEKAQVPLAVVIGPEELAQGMVRIKNMHKKDPNQGPGALVPVQDLVHELQNRLAEIQA